MARKSDFVAEVRRDVALITEGLSDLLAKQTEWAALDYGTSMEPEDLEGSSAAVLPADVGAVVFDTANALKAVLNAGHATNLYKLL